VEISKSPDAIAGMFDAIARRYDFLNHVLSAGIDRSWRRRAIRSLGLTGAERVLDLCTGTADLAIAARRAAPRARRVIGIDFARAMLAIGRDKVHQQAPGDAIVFVRGDATRVPLADCSIDAVTIAFGVRNIENPAAAMTEVYRVLVPGGRFAILEFAMPTTRVVRSVYAWYLTRVLPRIGRAISRDDRAYAYLPASVSAFSRPDEFVKILRHAGFTTISAVPLTLGTVFLYTGRRT
jgi:demethylmenaquinone methyltransferase/2-methoxy-6-polyprenyl-1,4-benzoquinol methylase